MKSWIIFDKTTGKIIKLKRADVHEKGLLGLSPSEDAVEGTFSDGLIDLDSMSPVPFPEKPSPYHEWDWPTKSWLPDIDAVRESQRQAWNAWRDLELVAGYLHNGHVFHSDDRFITELQLILKGYERGHITGTSPIRTRDNDTLQMTHAEIETLLLMIGLHRQAIYQQSWVGKDSLTSLTSLESIMNAGPPN